MDFATAFNRGNKLTVAICVIIVLTGLGTNLILTRLSAASDNIRVEQLHLAEFKAQLYSTTGLVESTKTATDRIEANQKLNQQLNALQALSFSQRVKISPELINNYVQAVRREVKLIDTNQLDAAARLRDNGTLPKFLALTSELETQNIQFGDEAGQFRKKGQYLKNLTFAVAGILILIVMIGFNRLSVADTQKEMRRHAQVLSGLRFAAVVQNSSDVILLTSRKGIVTLINEACEAAWGLPQKNCVGKHFLKLFESSSPDDLLRALDEALTKPNIDIESSIRIEVRPGVQHFFQVHIRNLLNNVHIGGLLLTFHDITERAAVEEALTHQATHDRLTGLPNRSQVLVRIEDALRRAKLSGHQVGVLFVDLDNFKTVNDTKGHEMGDLLLVNVAKKIQKAIRPSDMAARFGGDEFIVVFENNGVLGLGETIAVRIAEQFSIPFPLGGQDVVVTASIGVATSDDKDDEPNDLLRKADTAMYQAKNQGKSGYVVYYASMKMQSDRLHPKTDQEASVL